MENNRSVAEMKAKFEDDEIVLHSEKAQDDEDLSNMGVSVSKIKAKFEDKNAKDEKIDEAKKEIENEIMNEETEENEEIKPSDELYELELDTAASSNFGDVELNFVSDVAMTASEVDSNCEDEFEVRSYAQLNVSVAELRKLFEINMSADEAKAKIEEEVSKVYQQYTDETEEKIRDEVTKVAESIYEHIEQMLLLRDTAIQKLQDGNDILQNDNTLLQEKIDIFERKIELMAQDVISTKRNTFSNDQYLRQNNIEIEGIPKLDDDQDLEGVVVDVLKHIDVDVTSESFEACHRLLTSTGIDDNGATTICRFTNQRICEDIHRNKHKLKNLADNPSLSKVVIRDNINVYFKELFVKCSFLKQKKKIHETWTFKGIPIIKLLNDEVKHITHSYDLERLFPDFRYFDDDQDSKT